MKEKNAAAKKRAKEEKRLRKRLRDQQKHITKKIKLPMMKLLQLKKSRFPQLGYAS